MRVTGVVVLARGCKVGKGAAKAGKKFKKTPKKIRTVRGEEKTQKGGG